MLNIGEIVSISNDLSHDVGYAGQMGVVCNRYKYTTNNHEGLSDYSVLAFDKRANRFWCCGFEEKDLISNGCKIVGFLEEYNHWMKSQYNTNTEVSINRQKDVAESENKLATDCRNCINNKHCLELYGDYIHAYECSQFEKIR